MAIPKVKSFLWQVSHQALPIQAVLERRGVPVTRCCPFCDGTEDISYALMGCVGENGLGDWASGGKHKQIQNGKLFREWVKEEVQMVSNDDYKGKR